MPDLKWWDARVGPMIFACVDDYAVIPRVPIATCSVSPEVMCKGAGARQGQDKHLVTGLT